MNKIIAPAGKLLAGYGKADITPVESVPLRGYGSTEKRMSTGIQSQMFQLALAVTDSKGNSFLVIASDTCGIDAVTANDIRAGIEAACGVPADHIIVSALHHHAAPDLRNDKVPSSGRYREEIYIPGAIAAAKAAMENRAPATVQTATVETENMNFVRHYIMEDGSVSGPNFGNREQKAVRHAAEADNRLQLIKFIRKGQTTLDGKAVRDIILTNFQGHLLMATGAKLTLVNSDLVGVYRDELEEKLGCHAIYFSGASGNMMFKSTIAEENRSADYIEHGKTLAAYAIAAESSYAEAVTADVKTVKSTYVGNCNHGEDHMLEKAQRVWAEYLKTDDASVFRRNGFESLYHCSLLIAHSRLPATMDFDILGFAFGDVAIIGAPYEMFCGSGMAIKRASPFKNTVICTIANGYNGYLPTKAAWDYYCYERHNSVFERGTAEKLEAEFIKLLKVLHG